jgi:hypothetical protein
MSDAIEQQRGTKKTPRPPKPSFTDFIATLKTTVERPANNGLRQLRSALALGFADKEDPQLLAQTTAVLRTCAWIDRWAVQAAVTEVAGKLKKFHQQLLAELRNDFARDIGFFQLQQHGMPSNSELEAWIAQHTPPRTRENNATLPQPSREVWRRQVFVCLLSRTPADRRMQAVLTFIESWAGQAKKHTKEPQLEIEWYRFLGTVIAAEQPKSNRLAPIFSALYPMKTQLTTALNREFTTRREVENARTEIAELHRTATGLRDELAKTSASLDERTAAVTTMQAQLSEAEERYRLLDDHWKRSSATNVARKVGSLSQEIGHEVEETILSLDQPTPNLPMALNRLRRLQGIIQRQTGNREE